MTARPAPADEAKRRAMSRQRRRDTGPELAVRQRLHAMGYRYRVDHRPLPELRARGDLVFTRARVVVFVDGCFWHRCPQHGTAPKSNADWWRAKLDRNVARDREKDSLLADSGWTVLHFWEHEPIGAVADAVESAWRAAVPSRGRVAG